MSFDRHPYPKHSTAMPAHKDTQHPAGQVLPTVGELKGQQDLSDYIRSINRAQAFDDIARELAEKAQEKKLTFSEWYNQRYTEVDDENFISDAREIWAAALKYGKVS